MSTVRMVDRHGRAIVVDVPEAETTSDAVTMLADFMGPGVYFTGEHHPHNDAVRTLLEDEKQAAALAHQEAQERLWRFQQQAITEG